MHVWIDLGFQIRMANFIFMQLSLVLQIKLCFQYRQIYESDMGGIWLCPSQIILYDWKEWLLKSSWWLQINVIVPYSISFFTMSARLWSLHWVSL